MEQEGSSDAAGEPGLCIMKPLINGPTVKELQAAGTEIDVWERKKKLLHWRWNSEAVCVHTSDPAWDAALLLRWGPKVLLDAAAARPWTQKDLLFIIHRYATNKQTSMLVIQQRKTKRQPSNVAIALGSRRLWN